MKKVYMVSQNGEERGLTLTPIVENDSIKLPTMFRVNELDPSYSVRENEDGLELSSSLADYPVYYLKNLSLEDTQKIFPESHRKFESIDVMEDFVEKKLLEEMSYAVPEVNDTTYSFTLDDNDTVLEMIYTNADGDMYYRSDGEWVEIGVDDEMPTVFDRFLIDVLPEDNEKAVQFWDSASQDENDISKEDITKFAALVQ